MKKLFLLLACVAMSVLAMGQDNQLVWANGRLLYGTPVAGMDSLTYDDMDDVDTLHLLLPRTLIKAVHDTVYTHDTVYVETDCGGDENTLTQGISVQARRWTHWMYSTHRVWLTVSWVWVMWYLS